MKYRNGFVSNSSSSSFVVGFLKFPESAEELRVMLFGDADVFEDPYSENSWDAQEIADIVFKQMMENEPLDHTTENIGGILASGYYAGIPDSDDYVNYRGMLNKDDPGFDEQRKLYHDQWKLSIRIHKERRRRLPRAS